jgi:hypothetical protein
MNSQLFVQGTSNLKTAYSSSSAQPSSPHKISNTNASISLETHDAHSQNAFKSYFSSQKTLTETTRRFSTEYHHQYQNWEPAVVIRGMFVDPKSGNVSGVGALNSPTAVRAMGERIEPNGVYGRRVEAAKNVRVAPAGRPSNFEETLRLRRSAREQSENSYKQQGFLGVDTTIPSGFVEEQQAAGKGVENRHVGVRKMEEVKDPKARIVRYNPEPPSTYRLAQDLLKRAREKASANDMGRGDLIVTGFSA